MAKTDWLLDADRTGRISDMPHRLSINSAAWQAKVESIDLGVGLRVFLTEAQARTDAGLEPSHDEDQPWFATNVLLKGRTRLVFADGRDATLDTTRTVTFHPADRRARYLVEAGQQIRLSGYRISRERLDRILGAELPDSFQHLLNAHHAETRTLTFRTSGQMRRAAQAFYHSANLSGALRSAYLEGVILQLLAVQAAAADAAMAEAGGRAIDATIARKAKLAREQLLADIRNPPTLSDLAATAGMSEKALNAAFRDVFGVTVFEMLRNERLEHARVVIERENLPLKLVAARVGYRHASNFITAFAARFGETPRRYRHGRASED
ncbi:MAG TPA: helix-turn-helix transcriptional regulator [Bauldia sp.]|nr:helix-turn-helix transcriptional regulator [Bauldia sp.]